MALLMTETGMFASSTLYTVIQGIPQNYITAAFGVFSHLTFFSRVLCTNMHFKCRAEVEGEVAPPLKNYSKTYSPQPPQPESS